MKQSDIKSFQYEGDDSMISFGMGIPDKVPRTFKTRLVLKTGAVVAAPPAWRKKIWAWWYVNRRDELAEIGGSLLCQVAKDMLGPNYPGGRYPESGPLNRR